MHDRRESKRHKEKQNQKEKKKKEETYIIRYRAFTCPIFPVALLHSFVPQTSVYFSLPQPPPPLLYNLSCLGFV